MNWYLVGMAIASLMILSDSDGGCLKVVLAIVFGLVVLAAGLLVISI